MADVRSVPRSKEKPVTEIAQDRSTKSPTGVASLVGPDFDPLSQDLADNLWETLAEMRSTCPVMRSEKQGGFWALTRYSDVYDVAHDWETFCSREGVVIVPVDFNVLPENSDPPFQRELRKIIDPCFSPSVVAGWEDGARAIADRLIDGFAEAGGCDFISDFGRPFAAQVYFEEVLAIPIAEASDVLAWMEHISHNPQNVGDAPAKFSEWCKRLAAERRESSRKHDIVAALANGVVENGRPLTDQEVSDTMFTLTIGGLDTTANALGNIMAHLAKDPGFRTELEQCSDLPAAIEEFLRYEAPAPVLGRVATKDVELHGEQIKKGDKILIYFASANRDEDEFDRPNELLLDRGRTRHMTFGIGPHRCMGVHMARMMLRVALEQVLERMHGIHLSEEIHYRMGLSRAATAVNVSFEVRS